MENLLKVLAHSPAFWFLVAEDDRLFLDVNCSSGHVSYDVLIELNRAEAAQYSTLGQNYLDTLAQAIHFSGTGSLGSNSIYQSRNVAADYRDAVTRAIDLWKLGTMY